MNLTRVFIGVAVMAVVTYLIRVIPMAFVKKKITNRFFKSFLAYVPYAVLAAMTFPAILTSTAVGETAAAADLAAAGVGLLAALFLAYKGKGLLPVALGAAGAAFLAGQLIRLVQTGSLGLY